MAGATRLRRQMPAFQPPQVYLLALILLGFGGYIVILLVVSTWATLSGARRQPDRAETHPRPRGEPDERHLAVGERG